MRVLGSMSRLRHVPFCETKAGDSENNAHQRRQFRGTYSVLSQSQLSQGLVLQSPFCDSTLIRVGISVVLVKSAGKKVFIHCCGKIDELFPDLIECGVDVFNPFQPEVMDVVDIKRRYGDHITFFGGISTQKTLPYGTVAQVKEEVKRLVETVGRHGGYIAAPAHDVPRDAKPENVAAMLEVLQTQERPARLR